MVCVLQFVFPSIMAGFGFVLVIFMLSLCPGDSRFIKDPVLSMQGRLTSGVCSECNQMLELSTNMISNKENQEVLYETLLALCQRLPAGQASECGIQVQIFWPKVLQYAAGYLKPGQACMVMGLCADQPEKEMLKPPHLLSDQDKSSLAPIMGTSAHFREQISPQCTLCLFIMRKLEEMLPQNKTQEAVMKLMGEVCDFMPDKYKEQCHDFINSYGKEIIDFLLSSAAPHTICAVLHLCLFKDTSGTEMIPPSECESCRTLAVLSRLHLGLNSTEPQTSSFLQSVCFHHPNAIPKCEVFTKIYGSRLQKVLGNQMDVPDACERADLCVAVKKPERLGKERCTLGPSYWCQDTKIAQKCGNLAFCEKYMWK
ncbi:surfactant protein Bb [Myripristis murdjan]|uniref:Surfactant protein Bb n=1 Tax=Myripristis murdjan TaxID=586833 RepID=A0A667ZDC5_9TELE|nr:prosaposin-like [Myripristis murdjan]